VREIDADLVELLDTGLDAVRLVAAAPATLLENGRLPGRRLVVASEFERLTDRWIHERGLDAVRVRSFGATEVFPPEDADCIVDIAASGETLRANNLVVVDELLRSSTRLYANPRAARDPQRRELIDRLVMLVRSALEARLRVMIELNVAGDRLEEVVRVLPCMRGPTISPLHAGAGYAVKAAVPRADLPLLIPAIKARGGSDIVVTSPSQIIP
jgi:ATP phosphoribosyltransferase-like protein